MKVLQTTPETRKVQLDKYDRKILFALAQNCRTPYTQIAKQAGLSRDSIRYRIQRLKEAKVIQGYRTIVDITKLGFLNVHLFLQLNQPTSEAEKQLIEKFKSYPFVRAIIKINGKYDFELALIAKGIFEVEKIISGIIEDCGSYLRDYSILFVTKSFLGKTFPDNFLKAPQEEVKEIKNQEKKMDETDYKILSVIADNGDLPLHNIAQQVGVSADTIKYRMKSLVASGIILGFVPVINYDVINYNVYAIMLNISSFGNEKEATLQEFLRKNKDVLWGVKTIGKYNIILYICTTDPDDLIKTTTELRSYFTESVRNYETLINYEEYKYTYFPEIAKIYKEN